MTQTEDRHFTDGHRMNELEEKWNARFAMEISNLAKNGKGEVAREEGGDPIELFSGQPLTTAFLRSRINI